MDKGPKDPGWDVTGMVGTSGGAMEGGIGPKGTTWLRSAREPNRKGEPPGFVETETRRGDGPTQGVRTGWSVERASGCEDDNAKPKEVVTPWNPMDAATAAIDGGGIDPPNEGKPAILDPRGVGVGRQRGEFTVKGGTVV